MRRRSNCFIFAWWLYWKKGGYIALRKSRHLSGWGWHWLWSPNLRVWIHYVPREVMPVPRAFLHKLWYHGKIVRGDINGNGDMT